MATPLFLASEAVLKERLRLSAVPATSLDAEAIIDEAILRARVRFYTELGTARVNTLVAIAYTDLPTTDDGVLRAIANTCEVRMVYCTLLRLLPNSFTDASGAVNKSWNEEAPTRERGGMELDEELARCEREVVADLIKLAAPDSLECDEVQSYDGTPDTQTTFGSAPRVGMSLKRPFRCNPLSED